MENDDKEDIIDSDQNDQNNEEDVDTDNQSDDQSSDDNQNDDQSDEDQEGSQDDDTSDDNQNDGKKGKTQQNGTETEEAKLARLKRQFERQQRKMGILPPKKPAENQQQSAKVNSLSPSDTIAIIQSNVQAEDVDTVVRYAEFNKISITQALKDDVLVNTLKNRVEKRTTGNATHTGRARNGSSRVSGESLLKRAKDKGEIPDSPEALDAMLEERHKARG